jgi:Predicted thioesterase involved in non-ribosomal peptide biosynthesis
MNHAFASAWLPLARPAAGKLTLFGFPFAGGGADCFRDWMDAFGDAVQLCPVEYPGRSRRFAEPALDSMEDLAEAVLAAFAPYLDSPFAFFGHSMGGLLSYELARRLHSRGGPMPEALVVSGWQAAHIPVKTPLKHLFSDREFAHCLRELEGTPEEVLDCPELLELMLPVIRNDFRLVETWTHPGAGPLSSPILALGGDRDPEVLLHELEAWRRHSESGVTVETYAGGHFFLFQHRDGICARIAEYLEGAAGKPARHEETRFRQVRP